MKWNSYICTRWSTHYGYDDLIQLKHDWVSRYFDCIAHTLPTYAVGFLNYPRHSSQPAFLIQNIIIMVMVITIVNPFPVFQFPQKKSLPRQLERQDFNNIAHRVMIKQLMSMRIFI